MLNSRFSILIRGKWFSEIAFGSFRVLPLGIVRCGMSVYDVTTYGEHIAEVYDDWFGKDFDQSATIAALKDLAGRGPALELGIGTGRVALPLAATGLEVH